MKDFVFALVGLAIIFMLGMAAGSLVTVWGWNQNINVNIPIEPMYCANTAECYRRLNRNPDRDV